MSSLSWVTVVWSMIASASLTLAAIYWLAWYRNRTAWAHLLFSLTAVSLTALTFCELALMRAETPGELLKALKWVQLALFFLLVSITWFVAMYLRAGRLPLAWLACGMRAAFVLLNFFGQQNLNFSEITSLRRVQFLGEPVTVLGGVPNPVQLLGQLAVVLILIFVADASVTAWRRGDRRAALTVGGSVAFFILTGLCMSIAVIWGHLQAPIVFSLLYLGLVAVLGYELSTDVLRVSQLVHELRSTEAGLRERRALPPDGGHRAGHDLARRRRQALSFFQSTLARDGVQLSIVDDGRGFDLTGARDTGTGLGLVSINQRARLLRWTVRIETHAEKGTRLDVQIPSPHNVAADAWPTVGSTS